MRRYFYVGLMVHTTLDERDRSFDGRVLVVRIGQFQIELSITRWCKFERERAAR